MIISVVNVLHRLRMSVLLGCWVPVSLWGGSWAYLTWTDRWGAFAVGPVIGLSIVLSGAFGLLGVCLLVWQAWKRELDLVLVAATLLAGSVVVYATQH